MISNARRSKSQIDISNKQRSKAQIGISNARRPKGSSRSQKHVMAVKLSNKKQHLIDKKLTEKLRTGSFFGDGLKASEEAIISTCTGERIKALNKRQELEAQERDERGRI